MFPSSSSLPTLPRCGDLVVSFRSGRTLLKRLPFLNLKMTPLQSCTFALRGRRRSCVQSPRCNIAEVSALNAGQIWPFGEALRASSPTLHSICGIGRGLQGPRPPEWQQRRFASSLGFTRRKSRESAVQRPQPFSLAPALSSAFSMPRVRPALVDTFLGLVLYRYTQLNLLQSSRTTSHTCTLFVHRG